jgi:hypothetical protein
VISKSGSYVQAVDIVKAALAGGQLKLDGPIGNWKDQLDKDSQYLNGLINSLAENIAINANK